MTAAPHDLIVCPVCHGDLLPAHGGVQCPCCGRRFGGTPLDLTPIPPPDEELKQRWSLWEQLQANFLAAATAVPEHSLSVTDRPDANAFARFCNLSGTVLDIGCGTQRLPTYADTARCRFVGIDPLPGDPVRAFEFVQGLAEYLPFRTDSLDQALFATSLDHMLVPQRTVAEAARVIRPGGAVHVWFGEIDRPPVVPPPPGLLERLRLRVGQALHRADPSEDPNAEPAYLAGLEQPEGAVDKFHVVHPNAETIAGWLATAGLEPIEIERIDYANGCFIRGVKPARTPA